MFEDVDPRFKLIFLFLLSLILLFIDKIILLGCTFLLSFLLNLLDKISLKEFLKKIFRLNLFVGIFIFLLPFSFPQKIEGFYFAIKIILKANTLILFLLALIKPYQIISIFYALEKLKINKKLVALFFLIYRYLFLLKREWQKMENLLKVKNFIPKTDILTYKTYGYLLGNLFFRSYQASESLSYAMSLKGFNGYFPLLWEPKIKKKDFIFVLFFTLLIIILVYFQWQKF
uniref:Energy-coupling factor transporter transmembrane protein EcfT n=1 Tax=candidate division WOR-3 bacterium TaxID=2052148 RepID=A0A7V4E3B0_UNCW3